MPIKKVTSQLEVLNKQEEKILDLLDVLREERKRTQEKFPLVYALLATSGAACVFAGLNRIIEQLEILNTNPALLIALGLAILLVTGAAYKKLG